MGEEDDDEDDDEEDVIKTLHNVRHLYKGAVTEYLVEWVGYKNRSDWTWEPEMNLQSTEGKALLAEVKRSSKWPELSRIILRNRMDSPQTT